MRVIDADELKSKKEYSGKRHEWIVPVAAIDWISTIDPIHAADGCYCRECKYCYKNHCTYEGSCEAVADNHFCSYGKVRTE